MTRTKTKSLIALSALGLSLGLAACGSSAATSSDMCAYTQGTGQNNADAKVHKVYLPGEQFTKEVDENAFFFPCNSRNLRLMPGSTDVTADNKPVTSVAAYTKTGTKVIVDIRMDWMLNQDREVLEKVFIPFCAKYQCASGDAATRNDNFSTDGWSRGFLGENAVPALQTSTRDAIRTLDDKAWSDPTQKKVISAAVAQQFMDGFRATLGSTKDIMCGSGETSGWSGETLGEGTFKCAPVRVTVEDIKPADAALLDIQSRSAKANQEKEANNKELDAAKAKYGDKASEILGDLDRIEACAKYSKECNVYIGTSPNATK